MMNTFHFIGLVGGAGAPKSFFGSDSAVIDSRYRTRAAARFVIREGSSSSHDPFFSCEAACETRGSHDFEQEGFREGCGAFHD
jgi:hypothetical protein